MGLGDWWSMGLDIGIGIHGRVTCTLIDAETNEVVSGMVYENIQTNFSRNAFAQWVAGVSTLGLPPPTKIQLGNGIGTPSVADPALFAPISGTLYTCDSIQTVQTYYAQFIRTYTSTDPSGQYTEVGLFDAAGNLWGHVAINQFKSAQQLLTVQWQVYFTYDSTIQSSVMTNYALTVFPKWMTGTPSSGAGAVIPPTQIILGTGSGVPTVNDSALFSPVSATLKTCEYLQTNLYSHLAYFGHTFNSSDPAGTFTEMGLQDTNGNLWAHSLLNPTATRSGTNFMTALSTLSFQAS